MTWKIDKQTGNLIDPNGDVQTTLDKPYQIPDDAQAWAEDEFRGLNMADLTTARLADFAQLWVGDVEVSTDGRS